MKLKNLEFKKEYITNDDNSVRYVLRDKGTVLLSPYNTDGETIRDKGTVLLSPYKARQGDGSLVSIQHREPSPVFPH